MEIAPSEKARCCFCNTSLNDEVRFGKFYKLRGLSMHYFCLLLSAHIAQKGEDHEGVLGFLYKDILAEMKRGQRLICVYCKNHGATLQCSSPKCKAIFHLPCGRRKNSVHQFYGEFKTFCYRHRPRQRISANILNSCKNSETTCVVCYDPISISKSVNTLWAPCCSKNSWFHRDCVQRLALSAGYFFKCPLCNNKEQFTKAMQEMGIYIPEQDASWELEPNAYQSLLERHNSCDAPVCLCTRGRKYYVQHTKWEIILCDVCGSQGMHVECGNLKKRSSWQCPLCAAIMKKNELGTNHAAAGGATPQQNRVTSRPGRSMYGRQMDTPSTRRITRRNPNPPGPLENETEEPAHASPIKPSSASSGGSTPVVKPDVIDLSQDEEVIDVESSDSDVEVVQYVKSFGEQVLEVTNIEAKCNPDLMEIMPGNVDQKDGIEPQPGEFKFVHVNEGNDENGGERREGSDWSFTCELNPKAQGDDDSMDGPEMLVMAEPWSQHETVEEWEPNPTSPTQKQPYNHAWNDQSRAARRGRQQKSTDNAGDANDCSSKLPSAVANSRSQRSKRRYRNLSNRMIGGSLYKMGKNSISCCKNRKVVLQTNYFFRNNIHLKLPYTKQSSRKPIKTEIVVSSEDRKHGGQNDQTTSSTSRVNGVRESSRKQKASCELLSKSSKCPDVVSHQVESCDKSEMEKTKSPSIRKRQIRQGVEEPACSNVKKKRVLHLSPEPFQSSSRIGGSSQMYSEWEERVNDDEERKPSTQESRPSLLGKSQKDLQKMKCQASRKPCAQKNSMTKVLQNKSSVKSRLSEFPHNVCSVAVVCTKIDSQRTPEVSSSKEKIVNHSKLVGCVSPVRTRSSSRIAGEGRRLRRLKRPYGEAGLSMRNWKFSRAYRKRRRVVAPSKRNSQSPSCKRGRKVTKESTRKRNLSPPAGDGQRTETGAVRSKPVPRQYHLVTRSRVCEKGVVVNGESRGRVSRRDAFLQKQNATHSTCRSARCVSRSPVRTRSRSVPGDELGSKLQTAAHTRPERRYSRSPVRTRSRSMSGDVSGSKLQRAHTRPERRNSRSPVRTRSRSVSGDVSGSKLQRAHKRSRSAQEEKHVRPQQLYSKTNSHDQTSCRNADADTDKPSKGKLPSVGKLLNQIADKSVGVYVGNIFDINLASLSKKEENKAESDTSSEVSICGFKAGCISSDDELEEVLMEFSDGELDVEALTMKFLRRHNQRALENSNGNNGVMSEDAELLYAGLPIGDDPEPVTDLGDYKEVVTEDVNKELFDQDTGISEWENFDEDISEGETEVFLDMSVSKMKAIALTARKFRPPSHVELQQREMLRKLQAHVMTQEDSDDTSDL